MFGVVVSEDHGAVNEGSPGAGDLLRPAEDVPDDLLCPGGATLGLGHYPHVLLPGLDVVDEVVVLHVPRIDRHQPRPCLPAEDSHYDQSSHDKY